MFLNALWAVFPVTLAVLVALLVAKEVFDRSVRHKADRRKVAAIKVIVREELSRNVKTASALGQALHRIEDGIDDNCEIHLTQQSNALEVRTSSKTGGRGTLTLVRPVHKDALDQFVVDAAGLDRELFQRMLNWVRAASALEEVRTDLMLRGERFSEDHGAQQLKSFASLHAHPVADLRSTFHSGWLYCAEAGRAGATGSHPSSPHG